MLQRQQLRLFCAHIGFNLKAFVFGLKFGKLIGKLGAFPLVRITFKPVVKSG